MIRLVFSISFIALATWYSATTTWILKQSWVPLHLEESVGEADVCLSANVLLNIPNA